MFIKLTLGKISSGRGHVKIFGIVVKIFGTVVDGRCVTTEDRVVPC